MPAAGADLPIVASSGTTDSPSASASASARTAGDAPIARLAGDTPIAATNATRSDASPAEAIENRFVTVATDVLNLRIDRLGGEISYASLPQYPVSVDSPDSPFPLLDNSAEHLFIAQSGITPVDPAERAAGYPLFESAATHYTLQDNAATLEVRLAWHNPQGLELIKTFRFNRSDYVVEITQEVFNHSDRPWEGAFYGQLKRIPPVEKSGLFGARSYTGAAFSTQTKRYQKATFEEIRTGKIAEQMTTGGWIAMLQHYFLAVWIPPQDSPVSVYTHYQSASNQHFAGFKTPVVRIDPQASQNYTQRLYVGPKTQDTLKTIAPALERTVDYGYLFFIAEPLFWLLKNINRLLGNWGWSIIILTTLIKLAFFKLSEKSYRSMANMRQLSPKLKVLKERYADDKQRLNQETMELYKKEKINPLGGCLPIVIQMPVFISLYWMLLETVELRQAPFMFWIHDLSVRDPFFILPLIMGASMLLQQKLNPSPLDPTQQKVMMIMPVVFTAMFLFFPAGLVLYWVVNNVLSIAQQWFILKRVEQKR